MVVVSKFFARLDVAQGNNPHAPLDFVNFAIRFAGMIHESGNTISINQATTVGQTVKVSLLTVQVTTVAFFAADALTRVFHDVSALRDRRGGVTSGRMDLGSPHYKSHKIYEGA